MKFMSDTFDTCELKRELQNSNAERSFMFASEIMVRLQSWNERSPGILMRRPRYGTSMVPSEDAGICAALHRNEIARFSEKPGMVPLTTKRFVRTPPPEKAFTNPEILLVGSTGMSTPYLYLSVQPPTSLKSTPVLVAIKFNWMKLMLRVGLTKMSATNSLRSMTSPVLLVSSHTTLKSVIPRRC